MDIKAGLALVLDQIEREKGIKKEEILQMIEQAMISAYRKHAGEGLRVEANINPNGDITAYIVKTIVQKVADSTVEVSLKEAQKLDKNAQLNGEVRYPIDAQEFGRIAAQTAKQVLTQKIRETERENIYEEYKPKIGTLVNGSVHRFANRNVIVDLGRAEGILPVREQVRREHWRVGERIRVLIMDVEKGPKGPEVILSRASEKFVMRLFEQEVPEIYEKTVKVLAVVREPGSRSKVVVQSFNPKVDPIGACVGVKGSRVRPIINELQGERIDLVAHSDDTKSYIASSMAPAKPVSVNLVDEKAKKAEVLVADDAYSLAIGKNGQNVRLASKLTGWQIDIITEAQRKKESEENVMAAREMFLQLEGVGPRIAEVLIKGGMNSIKKIAACKVEDLTVYSGIGEKLAEKLIESSIEYQSKAPPEPTEENADVAQEGEETQSEEATDEAAPAENPSEPQETQPAKSGSKDS
ncbi:hypothetical protein BVX98_00600 [bacterium F11]|nr:hypothetical protein BVX98_00600 [bacterium F11]